ncbi:MAG TPA: hypothetical protein EYQ24_06060 [Bacteroidetes bacterium]|nr:hypothetical protein [Bacteroidota bacterium]HIL57491.1 hypothetical protein [Rhodothermales bacterium]
MRVRFPASALALALVLAACDTAAPESDGLSDDYTAEEYAADALADGVSTEAPALTGSVGLAADSSDLVVVFVPSVLDPVLASDVVFTGQDVRRRGYIQETQPAVAIRVPTVLLPVLLPVLELSPLVERVEDDIVFVIPALELGPEPYVPQRHDYTGAAEDLLLGEDPSFSGQMRPWSMKTIGANRSSAASGDGQGETPVDVYVIDSGVSHSDLNVVESVAFYEGSDPGSDLHGTHVAGIIGAIDDGDGAVGVAPGARIHSLDVFGGSETASMSQIMRAVDHVVAAKRANPSTPMVINLSLSAYVGTTAFNALDETVQAAIDERIPVVIAAGNGSANAAAFSPAHVRDAIVVGAADSDFNFAFDFSNRGLHVDLLAPGVRVVSTGDGDRYARLDGTSMAAPHVTGAVALILSATPNASPASVQGTVKRNGRNKVTVRPPRTTPRILWIARL